MPGPLDEDDNAPGPRDEEEDALGPRDEEDDTLGTGDEEEMRQSQETMRMTRWGRKK